MKKKLYLVTLERFGYELTVISDSLESGKAAILNKYIEVFTKENGTDPRKTPSEYYPDETYYDSALNDISYSEMELNQVEWL